MKKSHLFLVLLCCMFFHALPTFSEDVIIIDVIVNSPSTRPRTPEPSIYAYIKDGTLTISIERYLGYVSTSIEDANGTEVERDYEYINGTSTYVMNMSTLAPGTYTLYFAFADGRGYYGSFIIE